MSKAQEQSDKLLFSRIDDAVRLSGLRRKNVFIGFLNESQVYAAKHYLHGMDCGFSFFGGHKSALREYLCIYDSAAVAPKPCDYPINALEMKFRKADSLGHRDFLGAVTALGVTRESIGDIVVFEGHAFIFAEEKISEYLLAQITKIGSVGVRISVCSDDNLDFPQKYEEKSINIASMRLDNVTAALTGLSREKTAQLILSGLVSVNYTVEKNVSRIVAENDIISIRKTGKFIITDNSAITKKGRIRLSVKSFK